MKEDGRNNDKGNLEEDKRVVANMNIEGMPWHARSKPLYEESKETVPGLDRRELGRLAISATLSGIIIGVVFLVMFLLFILFSVFIWF